MAHYIDKPALVAEIEKLQSEIAEEKKLHEDNSMWYNGINHGFNLTKDILNTLEVKDLQVEPAEIDFEKELYKAFGQVKDFTLGMRIAKWFYDKGKNSQEPVSEDFEAEWKEYFKYRGDIATVNIKDLAKHFANWQKKQIEKEYDDFINKGLVSAKGVAVRMAYEKGKEEMINKACDWLDGAIPDYIELKHANVDTFIDIDNKKFVEDFRKAMED